MSITLKHDGLPEGISRFNLLEKFESVNMRLKIVSPTAALVLKLCVKYTQNSDYIANSICATWMRVDKIAKELGKDVRTINRAERELADKGFIIRSHRANGLRNGVREQDGITWAAGINLAPFINRYHEFCDQLGAIRLRDNAAEALKQEIKCILGKFRKIGSQAALEQCHNIIPNGRVSRIGDTSRLEEIRDELIEVLAALSHGDGAPLESHPSDIFDAPNILEKHIHKISRAEQKVEKLSYNLTPSLITGLASEEYLSNLEMYGGVNWPSIIMTSSHVAQHIGISQNIWGRACDMFGKELAALCIVIIERNHNLNRNHPYHAKNTEACLAGMIRKRRHGQLNLTAFIAASFALDQSPAVMVNS